MREVKFRGKNKNGEWVYGDLVNGDRIIDYTNSDLLDNLYLDDYGTIEVKSIMVDATSVGQYTGLKDKNGREIYEGGIALRRGKKYQIKMELGSFMLVRIDHVSMYEEFKNCWCDDAYPLSQLYWENGDSDYTISDLENIGN